MAGQCNATFDQIARSLGDFTCQDAPALLHLRNPFGLSNWTLPVLELMMVLGAVFALAWSIRRLRRDGDPTNLALWFATVIYLFVVEIPLYFPNTFGVEDQLGVVFAHNAFTVQFLFERLPLYIIALYPAVVTLAFEIVRSLGVFRDRGVIIGATCVGFIHHCFYEVFDQLGPQLRWWAWNTDNPINHPMLASVPMPSVFIFATLGPIVVTALVMLLVGRISGSGATFTGWSLIWRTVCVGALVPLGLVLLSTPSSLFGGKDPNPTGQAVVFTIELVIVATIAVPVLTQQWLRSRRGDSVQTSPNGFVRVFGPIYLGVLAVLWITSMPSYFGAAGGITADGTPVGNLVYATACFVAVAVVVYGVSSMRGGTLEAANRAGTSESMHLQP